MSDVWKVEENDGIVIAAHDNPPMNYFVGASAAGLAEMLPRWREPDVRVVIITGAEPGRCITHYSVEELVDLAEDREALIAASYELIFGWHSLLQSLSYLDKPIIAAMTGDTGGGVGIVNELADDAKARAIEVAERLRTNSAVALTAAKRSVVRGANLPMREGLRVEAEEWLKTIVTDEALEAMKSYVEAPFDQRRAWVRDHGAWPEPGSATGA